MRLVPRPPCPVVPGDRVHVPEPVALPSGRAVPAGHYDARSVEVDDAGRWRVVVEYQPDCSGLNSRFRPPSREERRAGAPIPLCALPSTAYLGPGDCVRYADGEGPAHIPDRRRYA